MMSSVHLQFQYDGLISLTERIGMPRSDAHAAVKAGEESLAGHQVSWIAHFSSSWFTEVFRLSWCGIGTSCVHISHDATLHAAQREWKGGSLEPVAVGETHFRDGCTILHLADCSPINSQPRTQDRSRAQPPRGLRDHASSVGDDPAELRGHRLEQSRAQVRTGNSARACP